MTAPFTNLGTPQAIDGATKRHHRSFYSAEHRRAPMAKSALAEAVRTTVDAEWMRQWGEVDGVVKGEVPLVKGEVPFGTSL